MSVDVSLGDGVVVELSDGRRVVCDGDADGDVTVLSHAHGDHLTDERPETLVCSPLTAALAEERRDLDRPLAPDDYPDVELRNAGHVAGSRAAYITDPDTGRTVCYTGDVCTRDRLYLDGFDPAPADDLVVETTYGTPTYRFPPTDVVLDEIREWLQATLDEVVLLFGYSLGRAQKLQRLAVEAGRDRVFVTDAIAGINEVVAAHRDVSFPVERYDSEVTPEPGDAVVLPMQTNRLSFVDRLAEETDGLKAGFSGWAVDRSFKYRGDYDVTFPLSDHCDFTELEAIVEAVDPERVFTNHGATEAFAQHVQAEYDARSRALKRDQRTLAEF
ncbi:MAG: MBL fold metallo-hydrolase RNA specificity domain-containing protein [Halolamina sp.]